MQAVPLVVYGKAGSISGKALMAYDEAAGV